MILGSSENSGEGGTSWTILLYLTNICAWKLRQTFSWWYFRSFILFSLWHQKWALNPVPNQWPPSVFGFPWNWLTYFCRICWQNTWTWTFNCIVGGKRGNVIKLKILFGILRISQKGRNNLYNDSLLLLGCSFLADFWFLIVPPGGS